MAYDVAVVGLGAMGSAACAQLARRGLRVAGLEQFTFDHERGSSSGATRIIRRAYFEDPAYVPLLDRAYRLWGELENETHTELLDLMGVVMIGKPDSATIRGVDAAARRFDITVERLDAAHLRRRFPPLRPLDDEVGIFEPHAGVVFPERGIAAHLAVARKCGADLFEHARVARIESQPRTVAILLEDDRVIEASRLVLSAGAWTADLAADVAPLLRVERNVQYWFAPRAHTCGPDALPAYFLERETFAAPLYGMPDLGGGVKAAFHGSGDDTSADRLDRAIGAAEIAEMHAALTAFIPDAAGTLLTAKACMYTMTADGNFAIGPHPRDARITLLCGFSGHGYKFAPVIGEIAADLAMEREPSCDIGFLSLARLRGGR
jgi:sarcosine oxidase